MQYKRSLFLMCVFPTYHANVIYLCDCLRLDTPSRTLRSASDTPISRLVVLGLIVTVGSLACSDFAPLHGMSVPFLSENNNNNNSNKSLHGILQIQIQNDSLKALSGILQIQIQNISLKTLSGILQNDSSFFQKEQTGHVLLPFCAAVFLHGKPCSLPVEFRFLNCV